jgi:hypothetical protein
MGVLSLLLTLLPVTLALSIMRYRLWDIDVIINRALVYGTLSATLAGVYAGGVIGLQSLLRAVTGQESDVVVIASTLAIAALFVPLRRRIQALIDMRFYRGRYNAERVLARFGATVRDEVDLERLSHALVGVVDDVMRPAHVSVGLIAPTGGAGGPNEPDARP